MKKFLTSLAIASTMAVAGGDVVPAVEPKVIETPVASAWNFGGNAVLYYETTEAGTGSLFDQDNSAANAGIQLRAANKDIFWGFGAGIELTGLGTLGLENDVVSGVMQSAEGTKNGGAITQAYLSYTLGNTTATAGRMTLDGAVSPFAYSEEWNVFKNTFEAVTLVNTDISNTTLVGAYVRGANSNGNLSEFDRINDDGIYMLTALNKTVDGFDLTASYYQASDLSTLGDTQILWGSGEFTASGADIGVQGGKVLVDNGKDTVGYGAKLGYDFGLVDTTIAYSHVDDGDAALMNIAGTNSVLYTNLQVNGFATASDAQTYMGKAGADVLGGNFYVAYAHTDSEVIGEFKEADVVYTTQLDNGLDIFAGYIYTDTENVGSTDTIRAWARYNF